MSKPSLNGFTVGLDRFKYLNITEDHIGRASKEDKLVLNNIGLVAHFVNKTLYLSNNISRDDIFQAGLEGLVRASKHFNPSMNVKFSSYASWSILRNIWATIYALSYDCFLSFKAAKKLFNVVKTVDEHRKKHGTEPNIKELMKVTGSDYETTFILYIVSRNMRVSEAKGRISAGRSDPDNISDEFEIEYEDPTSAPQVVLCDETYILNKYLNSVFSVIEKIPVLEASVLLLRCGIYDSHGYTIAEAGYILDLPPGRVRDIEFKAIQHIRNISTTRAFDKYLSNSSPWSYISTKIYEKHEANMKDLTNDNLGIKLSVDGEEMELNDTIDLASELDEEIHLDKGSEMTELVRVKPLKKRKRKRTELEVND